MENSEFFQMEKLLENRKDKMEDWRLTNQMDFLYKKVLQKRSFSDFPEKDHEHCSFCWDKFGKGIDMLKNGYCTEDAYHWICEDCFQDFKSMFEWTVDLNIDR